MNLQEQIIRILKEETKMNTRLRRRLGVIDDKFYRLMSTFYRPDKICKYKSGEELLDVVGEAVIEFMYFNHFSDMEEDHTAKWGKIYDEMLNYINNKYGDEIKKYYHINCGN
jgi:hypothetical protein